MSIPAQFHHSHHLPKRPWRPISMALTAQKKTNHHDQSISSIPLLQKFRGVKINLLITTTPHIFLPLVVNTPPLRYPTIFVNFSIPPYISRCQNIGFSQSAFPHKIPMYSCLRGGVKLYFHNLLCNCRCCHAPLLGRLEDLKLLVKLWFYEWLFCHHF